MFGQIVLIRIKTLGNTNTVVPRHIKREKSSLPAVMRRSKASLPRGGSTGIPQCSTMLKFQTGGKLRELQSHCNLSRNLPRVKSKGAYG